MTAASRWLALRLLAAALVAAALAALWTQRAWFAPETLQALLADRPWAPAAFLALHVAASLTFVPRTPLAVAAGLVFGLWWGIAWATLGSMLGAWAGFGLARLLGGRILGFVRLPLLDSLVERLEAGGWRAVWAIRLMPIMPHTPVNYAFGLTGIGWSAYSLGTLFGTLPSIVVAVSLGAAGQGALGGGAASWLFPLLIGAAALALATLLPRLAALRGR